jgi:beta-N-acetylhexosaminidase
MTKLNRMIKLSRHFLLLQSALFFFVVCHTQAIETKMITTKKPQKTRADFTLLAQHVAAKMVLDIRYFCDDDSMPSTHKNCRQGVTELPAKLSQLITESNIGGIVLFAENVIESKQVVTLTHDIQAAAVKSADAKPIIIAVDQEGGRVARFAKMTGFAGNMAIGATYQKHDVQFSRQVNAVLGKELQALGINNNYAPVVDVNTNASNPVINTRSYGENAQQVAKLGIAAVNALQAQGVMATLKHFPGHGDTHVDSHIGLPRVDHSLMTIEQVDLAPFTLAINKAKPAMIMTAHIQYPALDSSTFMAKSGEALIRPATMSKKILTDLLRNQMAFDGIIATDALDMAGISHHFTEVEAVVETFIAGADLAVMPFKIRKPSDIAAFYAFINAVAETLNTRINQGDYSLTHFEQSLERIERYKRRYVQLADTSLATQIAQAEMIVAQAEHLAVEQTLANAAVTTLKGDIKKLLSDKPLNKIHLIVANKQELFALKYALKQALAQSLKQLPKKRLPQVSYFIADSDVDQLASEALSQQADLIIATIDVKTASLVDIGGMDDLASSKTRVYGSAAEKQKMHSYGQLLKAMLTRARKQAITSVLIAKGSPYLLHDYTDVVDVILLNFDDRIYRLPSEPSVNTDLAEKQLASPGYNAAVAVIFAQQSADGHLPVSLNLKPKS